MLGALGDGLLADRWRENGNHHTVCLLTLLFLSFFFFLSPFPDTGVKDNIYRKPPIYKQHGTYSRIPLLLCLPCMPVSAFASECLHLLCFDT